MKHAIVMILSFAIVALIIFFQPKISDSPKIIKTPEPTTTPTQSIKVTDRNLLLPDMTIVPPKELYIANPSSKVKTIRFSTTFANVGKGPLEIIGHHDFEQSKTFATQYISKSSGGGEYQDIGEFVFHPEHKHWHVDNYVQYQLWTIKNNQKDQMLASTGKQSFCIWDEFVFDSTIQGHTKNRFYSSACSRNTQGMSVGWSDTYKARVEGQVLEISNIPDGQYILWFEINPDHKILESNYDNNSGFLRVEIKGNKLTII